MEVKKGYKQTEVGVIPKDWEVNQIQDVCKLINGRGFKPHEWKKEGLPIIRIQNLNGSEEFNYYQGEYTSKIVIEEGQLLFAWSGSRGTSFGPHIWKGVKGVLNYHTWKVNVFSSKIDKDFFLHGLRQLTKSIEDKAHGASALVHAQKWEMEGLKIPLPPNKSEQSLIAKVLSETDNLITNLEKVLAKKQAIKKGTLQALLTGKKRLPGFTEKWQTATLGKIGEINGAGVDKKINENEETIRLLNFMDVFRKDFIYSKDLYQEVTANPNQIARCSVKKGDIFFTPSSEMRTDIAISSISMEDIPDAVYSYHVVRLRIKDDWDLKFKTYIFKTNSFLNQAETLCEGGGKRYILTLKKFREMTITYPLDSKEQSAISEILYSMDEEIWHLGKSLLKYKKIKTGLMNQLLTGKIRLI